MMSRLLNVLVLRKKKFFENEFETIIDEFEISKCNYLEATTKTKWADGYIQSTLRYHLVNKNELSLLKEKKKNISN